MWSMKPIPSSVRGKMASTAFFQWPPRWGHVLRTLTVVFRLEEPGAFENASVSQIVAAPCTEKLEEENFGLSADHEAELLSVEDEQALIHVETDFLWGTVAYEFCN